MLYDLADESALWNQIRKNLSDVLLRVTYIP